MRAAEGDPQRAVELLALVLQHPSTFQVTKDRAKRLLSQLQSEMAPETFAAATTRGQASDLKEIVPEILRNEESER
jgi:hypothetical protein